MAAFSRDIKAGQFLEGALAAFTMLPLKRKNLMELRAAFQNRCRLILYRSRRHQTLPRLLYQKLILATNSNLMYHISRRRDRQDLCSAGSAEMCFRDQGCGPFGKMSRMVHIRPFQGACGGSASDLRRASERQDFFRTMCKNPMSSQ